MKKAKRKTIQYIQVVDTVISLGDFLEENKISYRSFANMVGINQSTVHRIIKGEMTTEETFKKIIKVINKYK